MKLLYLHIFVDVTKSETASLIAINNTAREAGTKFAFPAYSQVYLTIWECFGNRRKDFERTLIALSLRMSIPKMVLRFYTDRSGSPPENGELDLIESSFFRCEERHFRIADLEYVALSIRDSGRIWWSLKIRELRGVFP